jgi:hypothetical protein
MKVLLILIKSFQFTSSNINNLFSIVTPCKSRQKVNRITQLIVSSTDTSLKINTYEFISRF